MEASREFKEYLCKGKIYTSVEADEDIQCLLNYIGEDQLVIASDYPRERDQEETICYLRSREDLSEHAKEKILYQNAKKFYRLN